MNKKGQALVEFIIILPVLVYIVLIMIDILVIYNYKANLEGKIDEVVYLYKDGRVNEIDSYLGDINYNIKSDDKYTYIDINKEYEFMTPGISNI